nr:coatomer subunit zeta-2 isoform X2 [Anas platyrhynchos]
MEPTGLPEPSLYTVKALLVLDSHGQRLLAKYYDGSFPTAQEQAAFESSIFSKTRGAGGEITCLDGLTVVYRSSSDLLFCVVGGPQENELMLSAVLGCLCDALRPRAADLEKRWLLENLDGAFLVLDEIVDRGLSAGPRARSLRLRALRLPGGQPRAGGRGGRRPPQVEAPRGCSPPPVAPSQLPPPALGTAREPLRIPETRLAALLPPRWAPVDPKRLRAAPNKAAAPSAPTPASAPLILGGSALPRPPPSAPTRGV